MRLQVDIPDALHEKVRLYAFTKKIYPKNIVVDALEAFFTAKEKKESEQKP